MKYCFALSTGPHSAVSYIETIGKIEMLYKFFVFALVTTVIAIYFPAALYSFVHYYIFNKGQDSFFLLALAWFVLKIKRNVSIGNEQNPLFYSTKVSI